ncbi:MAG TPA: hypothetical protein VJS44_10375 [Pyrinomonadaceae bacterium]|nr:hypothetical protein [Pyrinomonadaceae bacterium]
MPTIKNLSYGMLTVELGESSITLGPRESKDISIDDADSPDVQRQLREGTLFVIPKSEGQPQAAAEGSSSADAPPAAKKDKPPKSNQ